MSDNTDEWVTCDHCGGGHMEFPTCGECGGMGWIDDEEDGGTETCPECEGEECHKCDSEGLILISELEKL